MPKETLINFVKEKLADGFQREEIKKVLLETGFPEDEIEEAFRSIFRSTPEKPQEAEIPKREEIFSYQSREEEISIKRNPLLNKKFLLPLFMLVAFLFLGGISAFVYNTFFKKIDPVSLLPQETAFYLRIKINPEDEQVKNLKENLNKFPYWEKFSQKISDEFEKLKEKNPPLKSLDFTISDEIIFAWTSPLKVEKIEEFPLLVILPNPDLKKLKKLSDDIKKAIEESKDWTLETENYKGRIIVKAIPKVPFPDPKLEPASTFTNGHFILATQPEDLKKIIDVVEPQGRGRLFKKGGGKEY